MSDSPIYAAVRVKRLVTNHDIAAVEAHARGSTSNARGKHIEGRLFRAIAVGTAKDGSLRGSTLRVGASGRVPAGVVNSLGMRMRDSYRNHLDASEAKLRKSAAVGLHMLVVVSPEWVRATGNPHSPDNPRVKALLNTAMAWAKSEIGGVWAARYDLNEAGSGVVDLLCSPTHAGVNNTTWVSVNKSFDALKAKHNQRKPYSALQDSWAQWAQEHLDPAIQRGEPISKTGRKHVDAERYKESLEAEQRLAEVDEARARANRARDVAREEQRKAESATFVAASERKELERERQRLEQERITATNERRAADRRINEAHHTERIALNAAAEADDALAASTRAAAEAREASAQAEAKTTLAVKALNEARARLGKLLRTWMRRRPKSIATCVSTLLTARQHRREGNNHHAVALTKMLSRLVSHIATADAVKRGTAPDVETPEVRREVVETADRQQPRQADFTNMDDADLQAVAGQSLRRKEGAERQRIEDARIEAKTRGLRVEIARRRRRQSPGIETSAPTHPRRTHSASRTPPAKAERGFQRGNE